MPNETTLSEFPKEVERYFICKLLHQRRAEWDGSYRYDEILKRKVPDIKMICVICSKGKDE